MAPASFAPEAAYSSYSASVSGTSSRVKYPLPHHCHRVSRSGRIFDCRVDLIIRNTARPQVPCNSKLTLLSRLRAIARELLGVALVVQLAVFFQAGHDYANQKLVIGAAS